VNKDFGVGINPIPNLVHIPLPYRAFGGQLN
jgi:hypothetical protein